MTDRVINGIYIKATNFEPELSELENYVKYVQERVPDVFRIKVSLCEDGCVDLDWAQETIKFERIRRITGYLVGTVDRWNDSKRAEEHDRVKHVGGSP